MLGEDLKNFRILFIKILKLSEFRIDLSRLFHLIITEGKKELLKRLCLKGKRGIFLDDLVYETWFEEVVAHKGNVEIDF